VIQDAHDVHLALQARHVAGVVVQVLDELDRDLRTAEHMGFHGDRTLSVHGRRERTRAALEWARPYAGLGLAVLRHAHFGVAADADRRPDVVVWQQRGDDRFGRLGFVCVAAGSAAAAHACLSAVDVDV